MKQEHRKNFDLKGSKAIIFETAYQAIAEERKRQNLPVISRPEYVMSLIEMSRGPDHLNAVFTNELDLMKLTAETCGDPKKAQLVELVRVLLMTQTYTTEVKIEKMLSTLYDLKNGEQMDEDPRENCVPCAAWRYLDTLKKYHCKYRGDPLHCDGPYLQVYGIDEMIKENKL